MTREQVFSLIQEHLADELEVDPAVITDETRFKEDLEADSLDLYTLVQELEDSYGVKISDEEATKILTVGRLSTSCSRVEQDALSRLRRRRATAPSLSERRGADEKPDRLEPAGAARGASG